MALPWFQRFDTKLTTLFPLSGETGTCPVDTEVGAWFISPSQHLVEGTIYNVVALLVAVVAGRKFKQQLRAQEREAAKAGIAVRKPDPPTPLVRFLDVLLTTTLFMSACMVVYHKWNAAGGNKMPYLLQPCHLLHAFLLYILTLPRGSTQGAVLLSIYLHELFAPFLGSVAADLSCYKQRFEALNWGIQHGLLLLVPLHLLATRRFGDRVHGGAALFAFSFALLTLLHYVILVPMSVLTGTNLNYVMCAPPSVPAFFATWYRAPMLLLCALLAWALRYLFIDAFLKLVVDRDRSKHSKAKVEPEDSGDEAATTTSSGKEPSSSKDGLRRRN